MPSPDERNRAHDCGIVQTVETRPLVMETRDRISMAG
jgi:hypothetical protein